MGLRLSALFAVLAAAGLLVTSAAAATRHDVLPLHVGSSGTRVSGLQWMLGGHRPNVFDKVKGTFTAAPTGYFGARTGAAVYAFKYRIGYPAAYNSKTRPVAGSYFFGLLRGTRTRPASWVANAAARVRATEPGVSPMALKIRTLEQTQLGVTESPYGSNRGPRISYSVGGVPSYQSSTGAYGAAWCVSFTAWSFIRAGYGSFADRTAGVFYAVSWAARRNLLHARPKVGSIVAFMDGQGHMGTVVKITASGFVSIEGNASQRVLERFHLLGDRRPVFIYLPGVA